MFPTALTNHFTHRKLEFDGISMLLKHRLFPKNPFEAIQFYETDYMFNKIDGSNNAEILGDQENTHVSVFNFS